MPSLNRYEVRSSGHLIGVLEYHRQPDAVVIDHVEVDPGARGRGIAGHLTETAVTAFEAEGIRIVPVCPYAQHWIATREKG